MCWDWGSGLDLGSGFGFGFPEGSEGLFRELVCFWLIRVSIRVIGLSWIVCLVWLQGGVELGLGLRNMFVWL